MIKEYLDKWVAALRSGDYTQGKSYLHSEDDQGTHNYCCLGVLCDVVLKDKPELVTVTRNDVNANRVRYFYGTQCEHLPLEIASAIKTRPNLSILSEDENGDTLKVPITFINDGLNWDFNKIADAIEEGLLDEEQTR